MLTLLVYPPAFGEINPSPFVTKALCLLGMTGQPFDVEVINSPRSQPKRKLPVLHHNGKVIPDSDQIRDYLQATFRVDFDEGLSDADRAQSRLLIRSVEEHLYFAVMASRWQEPENWAITRAALFGDLPAPIRGAVAYSVRRQVLRTLWYQGMGRHSAQERVTRAEKDIVAIENVLGDKDYLFGDRPTAADATVVPMLRAQGVFPRENAMSDLVLSRPRLARYIQRGFNEMYPVLDKLKPQPARSTVRPPRAVPA